MNSCILMAEIIQEPQLRYTQDTQTPLTEMLVQFPGPGPQDPPGTLKVIGWGNVAGEIHEKYHQGDRVLLEGRLNMITIERPEGFKEKRAELTVQRIYNLRDAMTSSMTNTTVGTTGKPPVIHSNPPSNVVPLDSRSRVTKSPTPSNIPSDSDYASDDIEGSGDDPIPF